jgi:hypothetical protein
VANKGEQTALANELEKEKEAWSAVDPVNAGQIFINKTLKDLNQYVVIERKYRAVFTAFLRDEKGLYRKITVDPERSRMLRLMIKDGKTRAEIEEVLNGLTDSEIEEFSLEK